MSICSFKINSFLFKNKFVVVNIIYSISKKHSFINKIQIVFVMTESAGFLVVCVFDISDKEEIRKLSAG